MFGAEGKYGTINSAMVRDNSHLARHQHEQRQAADAPDLLPVVPLVGD